MLTKIDIQTIISECRKAGEQGLGNGIKAVIDSLTVDFLIPPLDFLGTSNNPAIFVNHGTYNLLGKFHQAWELNKTIAVKENFLTQTTMTIIGIIVHETGHAFNVAAKIDNSEANAYIFEIDVLSLWFNSHNPVLDNCSLNDLQSYFELRRPFYSKETKHCKHLARLVASIDQHTLLKIKPTEELCEIPPSKPTRFVVPTPTLRDAFFKTSFGRGNGREELEEDHCCMQ